MTTRERKEARIEKRREWAEKAAAESRNRFDAAHKIAEGIPFGQPILCGHHSERHARRDKDRIASNMDAGCEAQDRAQHHTGVAAGIRDQLDRSIYSDDANAIDALRARISEREANAEKLTAINKLYRKHKGDVAAMYATGEISESLANRIAKTMTQCPWMDKPFDTTSDRAAIRRDKERIAEIEKRQALQAKTEAAGGTLIETGNGWTRVTFAEYPGREIVDALKAAGYRWSAPSWQGTGELPKIVFDTYHAVCYDTCQE